MYSFLVAWVLSTTFSHLHVGVIRAPVYNKANSASRVLQTLKIDKDVIGGYSRNPYDLLFNKRCVDEESELRVGPPEEASA